MDVLIALDLIAQPTIFNHVPRLAHTHIYILKHCQTLKARVSGLGAPA